MKKIPALSISVTSESAATPSAPGVVPESPALPAVVAKAFGRLNNRLRARMLRRLLTSVGPLALAVVGGGAFAKYLKNARWTEIPVSMEDPARATSSQVLRTRALRAASRPAVVRTAVRYSLPRRGDSHLDKRIDRGTYDHSFLVERTKAT
jgi:hypothetical protein